jgi:hypothetical protein
MTAQDALNKLVNHLLGRDWYIADPVGGEQANEIIVDQICKRYPAVDEDPVDRYRRRHKKCIWCKYYCSYKGSCDAKSRGMNTVEASKPHPFCTLFKLDKHIDI